jgi:hypothetical protein
MVKATDTKKKAKPTRGANQGKIRPVRAAKIAKLKIDAKAKQIVRISNQVRNMSTQSKGVAPLEFFIAGQHGEIPFKDRILDRLAAQTKISIEDGAEERRADSRPKTPKFGPIRGSRIWIEMLQRKLKANQQAAFYEAKPYLMRGISTGLPEGTVGMDFMQQEGLTKFAVDRKYNGITSFSKHGMFKTRYVVSGAYLANVHLNGQYVRRPVGGGYSFSNN